MKLYDLRADFSSCCAFVLQPGETGSTWGDDWFDGTPRGDAYPVPKGCRHQDRIDGPLPDYTEFDLGPFPTFSERAIHALGSLLKENGEFAAIELDEPLRYFAFNTTTIVDILDEARSEIARFRDGRVMAVDQLVLLGSVANLPPIFKIPQTRVETTYVSEEFVTKAQEHRLSGFRFDLLFQRG